VQWHERVMTGESEWSKLASSPWWMKAAIPAVHLRKAHLAARAAPDQPKLSPKLTSLVGWR